LKSNLQRADQEAFKRLAYVLEHMAPLADPDAKKPYPWLDYMRRGLIAVMNAGDRDGIVGAEAEAMLRFAPSRAPGRTEEERGRLAECGALGGRARTVRKQAASRKNGRLGGRPVPDRKTLILTIPLLIQLKKRRRQAWIDTANYQYEPRLLRALVSLMRAHELTNSDLMLPEKWDPSKRSRDPHMRIARLAKHQGFWLKTHPPLNPPW